MMARKLLASRWIGWVVVLSSVLACVFAALPSGETEDTAGARDNSVSASMVTD